MERRGASQVEFILSFVLFSGAVLFLIFAFNPAKIPQNMDSTLMQISNALFENISSSVEMYGVKINPSFTGASIAIDAGDTIGGVSAEDSAGNNLRARKSDGLVYLDMEGLPEQFVYLFFGEDIVQGNPSSGTPNDIKDSYDFGSVQQLELISEKKILDFNNTYFSSYDELKKYLGVPPNLDFDVVFKLDDKEINLGREVPSSVEIFSQQYRKKILKLNGDVIFADAIIRIW